MAQRFSTFPCGGGIIAARLRPDQQVRYLATDMSADMLDHARRRLFPA